MSKIFTIRWTQTLQEDFEVEAETEEEAIAAVENGECGDIKMVEGNDFQVIKEETV